MLAGSPLGGGSIAPGVGGQKGPVFDYRVNPVSESAGKLKGL